jgi:hypothetical protein
MEDFIPEHATTENGSASVFLLTMITLACVMFALSRKRDSKIQ